ncbi:hypothetical protein PVAP13_8KG038760 [Panicum virgatum]|uniref:Uncharacterized protein n=1 Tax=Panicum virgatum TaxID=38727 RepID=A0A8T0PF68_PANVG|nr:hypothetical protein PVAP13_8KG038760 [Panicum virgatum]
MPGHEMGANHNLKNRDNMDIHKVFISLVLTLFIAGQLAAGVVAIEELVGTPILARGSEQLQGIFLFLDGGEGLRQRGCVCCRLGEGRGAFANLCGGAFVHGGGAVTASPAINNPQALLRSQRRSRRRARRSALEVSFFPCFCEVAGDFFPVDGIEFRLVGLHAGESGFFCWVACSGCWSR